MSPKSAFGSSAAGVLIAEPPAGAPAPRPKLSLRANVAWSTTANIVYSTCQWGILGVLAKLQPPEMVGSFALALAICTPLLILSQFQLRAVEAGDVTHRYSFQSYLELRILATAATLLVTVVFAWIAFSFSLAFLVTMVTLFKSMESISDITYGFHQSRQRMDIIAVSMTCKGLLSVFVFAAILILAHSLALAVFGLAMAVVVVLFAYDLPSTVPAEHRGRFWRYLFKTPGAWEFAKLKALGKETVSLGVSSGVFTLVPNIPRYFIEHSVGKYGLGVYAALNYVIVAGITVMSALGSAALPRLAELDAEGRGRDFAVLTLKLVLLAALVGICGIAGALLLGKPVLLLLYRKEYAEWHRLLVWVMVFGTVHYLACVLGYVILAKRWFFLQMPMGVAVCLITAIGCVVLIPRAGLYGAVWATIIGTGTCLAISIIALCKPTWVGRT